MGGLEDATNVEKNNLSVITSISLDHTNFLWMAGNKYFRDSILEIASLIVIGCLKLLLFSISVKFNFGFMEFFYSLIPLGNGCTLLVTLVELSIVSSILHFLPLVEQCICWCTSLNAINSYLSKNTIFVSDSFL